jgi:hypothetical protein
MLSLLVVLSQPSSQLVLANALDKYSRHIILLRPEQIHIHALAFGYNVYREYASSAISKGVITVLALYCRGLGYALAVEPLA